MSSLPPPPDEVTRLAVAVAATTARRWALLVNGRLVIVTVADADGRIAPLAPLVASPPPAADRWAECKRDVLAVLSASPTPLKLDQLATALEVVRTPHGRSVLTKALAEMTRAGVLVNPGDKRGYRLPGWTPPAPPPLPRGTFTPDLFD